MRFKSQYKEQLQEKERLLKIKENVASCTKMINEILKVEMVDGIDSQELTRLKFKAIESINECSNEFMRGAYKYSFYFDKENPDFSAYFGLKDGNLCLIFRQDMNMSFHSYLETPEEILKGIKEVEEIAAKIEDKKEGLEK